MKPFIPAFFCVFGFLQAPVQEDSLDNERLAKMINLSEVIIRTDLNVPRFITQVKNDTTFYKAFRNLHIIGYTAWNDIRIKDKKGKIKASLLSNVKQYRSGNCWQMEVLDENSTGDFYNKDGGYNYNTGEMYAGLFFTKGKICGENNIVKGIDFNPRSLSGMVKHKEQLKMLFFNPEKKIPGTPFIGDKINIFEPDQNRYDDFLIDFGDYEGQSCYLVPTTLRYIGNWDVAFKKRERGAFTATLFDFNE